MIIVTDGVGNSPILNNRYLKMTTKFTVFWDVTPCILVVIYRSLNIKTLGSSEKLVHMYHTKRYHTPVIQYTTVTFQQFCISALVLLVVVGAEDGKKKQEKRGLVGLAYGTLGGYGVGSGLAGYSGIGLSGHGGSGLLGYGGIGLGGLGLAPPPVPVAAPAPSPVLPPPPVYALPHVIGASVHTTITKQVSIGVTTTAHPEFFLGGGLTLRQYIICLILKIML
jgi:hypothetical protein